MAIYLDLTSFKALSTMPSGIVDDVESVSSGWVLGQLGYWSAWIDSRLGKRYAVPFSSPYPVAVTGWLARIVTLQVWLKRGIDATDEQFLEIKSDANAARDEIKAAANSNVGLFDLPERADVSTSGISRGGPLSYSESSPYVWADRQRRIGREEDRNGGGIYG